MLDMNLTKQYQEFDQKCATFYYKLHNKHEFEPKCFIPSEENIADAWSELHALEEEVQMLEAPDGVYQLMKHHFIDFIESLAYIMQEVEDQPFRDFFRFHYYFLDIARMDKRHDLVKQTVILNRIAHLRKHVGIMLKRAQAHLSESEQLALAERLKSEQDIIYPETARLIEYFPSFSTDQIRALADAFFALNLTFDHVINELSPDAPKAAESAPDDLDKTIQMDHEKYRSLLANEHGVVLDELLRWSKDEINKTRKEVFEIASKLDIEEPAPTTMGEVNEILFKYEGPCDSPEEMFRRADAYLKRTRALAHEYVKLPDDEQCICRTVPECLKISYPWGGYEGGDFRKPPYHGYMFLNNHNYQNVTDGWIKLNSLHEAYPGHHVQFVRSAMDPLPETVKIGAKLTPLLEGTCLRTERAFETLFEEDPFFPLFVAYRRHHGAVRICVDLMLYYEGAPLKDAVAFYEKELGFDFITARGQVLAQQNMPGYFTCYYYGMKKIEDWDKKLGLSKKDFTELLFSAGFISMESFDMLASLTPEERNRYFTEFKSLRMK